MRQAARSDGDGLLQCGGLLEVYAQDRANDAGTTPRQREPGLRMLLEYNANPAAGGGDVMGGVMSRTVP